MDPKLRKKITKLPLTPGVYLFKDKNNRVLYVGKANRLRSRVGSYFSGRVPLTTKTGQLVQKITDLDHLEVDFEAEALILEADLIKKYQPQYNLTLKDDKSYAAIIIERGCWQRPGRVTTSRSYQTKHRPKLGQQVFGPFPDGRSAKQVVRFLRTVYPFRTCSDSKYRQHQHRQTVCLYGHLDLCPGPCRDDPPAKKQNTANLRRIKLILAGKRLTALKNLNRHMYQSAREENFEKAAQLRDKIIRLEYVSRDYKASGDYLVNPNLVTDLRRQELEDLISELSVVDSVLGPRLEKNLDRLRIETFDISTLMAEWSVGSLVVSLAGKMQPHLYRRFRIKSVRGMDDYAMLGEVICRRLKPNNLQKWGRPDIIVVDGGIGQLTTALFVLQKANLKPTPPLLAIAKRQERVYAAYSNRPVRKLDLSFDRPALQLIKRGRDEAHRFAISYHRQWRRRQLAS